MSKNIFDFDKTQEKKESVSESSIDRNKAEELINHYQNYSQDELMSELFRVANSEKEKGTLTREKLEGIKSTILPYLNENQIDFLNKLIEKLNV